MSRSTLIALAMGLAGCGRLLFEHQLDAGGLDAAAMDWGAMDSGAMDSGAIDAALDAPPDAGSDAGLPPDFCVAIPSLASEPVIDGVPEPGVQWQTVIPVDWTSAQPLPSGQSARWAVAWRADGLYVVVDVDDPTRIPPGPADDDYCGDGVEIYVDDDGTFAAAPAYDVPGTRQAIAVAPSDDATAVMRGTLFHDMGFPMPWTQGFVARPRAGGYVVEAMIRAPVLARASWTLAAGSRVGLDLSVNVSLPTMSAGDCGYRLGQYFLRSVFAPNACRGRPFCDVRSFCTPVLE